MAKDNIINGYEFIAVDVDIDRFNNDQSQLVNYIITYISYNIMATMSRYN